MPEYEAENEYEEGMNESSSDCGPSRERCGCELMYNVTLFLKHGSDIPQKHDAMVSHKNVVLHYNPVLPSEIPDLPKGVCSSVDVYKETLQQRVDREKECDGKFITSVMRQVLHGIDHLHKHDRAFGELKLDHVFISCCEPNDGSIVLTKNCPNERYDYESSESEMRKDLSNLASFYCTLLTNCAVSDPNIVTNRHISSCFDNGLSLSLIKTVHAELISTSDVIHHPFFWTDSEKVDFICEAFDRIKHIKKTKRRKVDEHSGRVIGDNWFRELSLRTREKTEIEKRLKRINRGKKQVSKDTILNLAKSNSKSEWTPHLFSQNDDHDMKNMMYGGLDDWKKLAEQMRIDNDKKEAHSDKLKERVKDKKYEVLGPLVLIQSEPYREDSLYDLMRFFRNKRAHYWESKENVKNCFQSYPEGFWKFFSIRFPELLPFVYENRKHFGISSLRTN